MTDYEIYHHEGNSFRSESPRRHDSDSRRTKPPRRYHFPMARFTVKLAFRDGQDVLARSGTGWEAELGRQDGEKAQTPVLVRGLHVREQLMI